MKTIIAGSRHLYGVGFVQNAVEKSGFSITEVVSGECTGIDKSGELWAQANHVPIKKFPADWNKHGKAAGPIRNREMAEYADAAIVIWDGQSKGSMSMINLARQLHLKLFIVEINQGKL